jgi:hypothetical protein
LSLTSNAEQTVPTLMASAQGVSARAADALSADELDTLLALLRRLVDHESRAMRKVES